MKKNATLFLCGLGSQPPEETTCEVLQALEACRIVFTDVDAPTASWLRTYAKNLAVFPSAESDAAKVQRIVKELAKGGAVGVAVWGHPLLTSPLCLELKRRAKGVEVRVPGAVSPPGVAGAAAPCASCLMDSVIIPIVHPLDESRIASSAFTARRYFALSSASKKMTGGPCVASFDFATR